MTRLAFVCVRNAGRSQMASAFAEQAIEDRGLDVDVDVDVVSGGTDPAEDVHPVVVEAMQEVGIDLGDREPRRITPEDAAGVDHVVTMGCSVEEFRPTGWQGQSHEWELEDPEGSKLEAVREQRDEIQQRVEELLDEIQARKESTA